MKCFVYYFLIFFVFSSCNKKELNTTRWEVGTYLWDYSFYNGTVINSDDEYQKFAIIVRKNGKVEIYEDQKLIDFGRFRTNDATSIQMRNGFIDLKFNVDNVNLSMNFPFNNYFNYFKKVKY